MKFIVFAFTSLVKLFVMINTKFTMTSMTEYTPPFPDDRDQPIYYRTDKKKYNVSYLIFQCSLLSFFLHSFSFCELIRNYIRKRMVSLLDLHNCPILQEQPQRTFVCFQTTVGICFQITARRRWGHRVSCRTFIARACPIMCRSSFYSLRASCHCWYRLSEGDSYVAGTGLPVLVFIGGQPGRRQPVRARLLVFSVPSPDKWRTSATKRAALKIIFVLKVNLYREKKAQRRYI